MLIFIIQCVSLYFYHSSDVACLFDYVTILDAIKLRQENK